MIPAKHISIMKTKLSDWIGSTFISAVLMSILGINAAQAGTVSFNYDSAGRLVTSTFAANKSIAYVYNHAGNLVQRAISVGGVDPDNDGDGIPDWWMQLHFGHPTGQAGDKSLAHDDADEDRMTNLHEFLAGTLPKDASSALRVAPTPVFGGGGVTVEWQSVPGRNYRLQFKETLNDSDWTNVPGDVTAGGAVSSKSDPTATGQTQRFYRVLLIP